MLESGPQNKELKKEMAPKEKAELLREMSNNLLSEKFLNYIKEIKGENTANLFKNFLEDYLNYLKKKIESAHHLTEAQSTAKQILSPEGSTKLPLSFFIQNLDYPQKIFTKDEQKILRELSSLIKDILINFDEDEQAKKFFNYNVTPDINTILTFLGRG